MVIEFGVQAVPSWVHLRSNQNAILAAPQHHEEIAPGVPAASDLYSGSTPALTSAIVGTCGAKHPTDY